MRNSVLTSWSASSYEPSYPAYEHGRGFYTQNVKVSDTDTGA